MSAEYEYLASLMDNHELSLPDLRRMYWDLAEAGQLPGGGAVTSVAGRDGVVVLTADDMTDGATNHVFTSGDDTKLAGIATAATANDTDANLKARANHTGAQAISTVTDLQTTLDDKVSELGLVFTTDPRLASGNATFRQPTAVSTFE